MEDFLYPLVGFEVIENDIWYVPLQLNMLCRYSIPLETITEAIELPNCQRNDFGFYKVKKVGTNLILIPAFESKIYIYELIKKQIKEVTCELMECEYEKYEECAIYHNAIYFFPADASDILKLNLSEQRVTMIKLNAEVENTFKNFVNSIQVGDSVYLVNETNAVSCFCMSDDEMKQILYLSDETVNFVTIVDADDAGIWLTDDQGKIYILDIDHKCIKLSKDDIGWAVCSGLFYQNNIYYFPKDKNNSIVRYDLVTNEFVILNDIKKQEKECEIKFWGAYSQPKLYKDKIYVVDFFGECFLKIDIRSYKITRLFIEQDKLSLEIRKAMFKDSFLKNKGGYCEKEGDFNLFLEMIISGE